MTRKGKDGLFEVLCLLGAIASSGLFIVIGRWLFASGMIPLLDVEPSEWVSIAFIPASLIVLGISAVSAILWYVTALKLRPEFMPGDDMFSAKMKWGAFLFASFLSIIIALYFFGETSQEALPYLFVCLFINMLISFWLSTALATPSSLSPAVLFAPLIRSILGLD